MSNLQLTNSLTKKNFVNRDISNGDYRESDLFKSPFNFKKNYIYKFNDTFHPVSKNVDQQMFLWKNLENQRYISQRACAVPARCRQEGSPEAKRQGKQWI